MLSDRVWPLAQRLAELYEDYLTVIFQRVWYRGFLHIAVQDALFCEFYLSRITSDALGTVLAGTRHELAMPVRGLLFTSANWNRHGGDAFSPGFIGFRLFIVTLRRHKISRESSVIRPIHPHGRMGHDRIAQPGETDQVRPLPAAAVGQDRPSLDLAPEASVSLPWGFLRA